MSKVHILIAGRDPASLEVIKKMLKYHNRAYDVEFATDGETCLQRAKEKPYDLILLDNDLPDRDGLQLIDELKQAGVRAPIILMVEDGQDDVALAAMDRGAQDYVMKVRGYLTALPFTVLKAIETSKDNRPAEPVSQAKPETSRTSDSEAERRTGPEGYFVLDRRGRFLSADKTVQEILEYSEAEILELSIADVLSRGAEGQFYRWLRSLDEEPVPLQIGLVTRRGAQKMVELRLTPIKDDAGEVAGYKGRMRDLSAEAASVLMEARVDQRRLILEVTRAIEETSGEPVPALLQRLAEIAAQQFRFLRATVALLDQRRRVFVKHALVGYDERELANKAMEVPKELVDRIFQQRFRIKVIYSDQEFVEHPRVLPGGVPERRTQVRRPHGVWDPKDLILVGLTDDQGRTIGFVSLEQPANGFVPTRDTFYNLELFSILASFAVEDAFRREHQERRYRRMKQFLASSTLFYLDTPFSRTLNDFAWLVRFLSDFNLVMVGIITRQSESLEFKAVACEDRVKAHQLTRLKWSLTDVQAFLRKRYRVSESYLVDELLPPVKPLKSIYYGAEWATLGDQEWSKWHLLVVPIRTRQGKVVGAVVLDDPRNGRIPSRENVHLLELFANQVGIAVEDRLLLLRRTGISGQGDMRLPGRPAASGEDETATGLRRLVEKFLR